LSSTGYRNGLDPHNDAVVQGLSERPFMANIRAGVVEFDV
jgi:hypothetical protein